MADEVRIVQEPYDSSYYQKKAKALIAKHLSRNNRYALKMKEGYLTFHSAGDTNILIHQSSAVIDLFTPEGMAQAEELIIESMRNGWQY